MTTDPSNRPLVPGRERRRRRSLGAEIFARTLADRRVLIRKLVVGEAIGDRPTRGFAVAQPQSDEGESSS